MADHPNILSRLPRWLSNYLNCGLDIDDDRLRRERAVRNVLSLSVFLTALNYCAVFLLIDAQGLWPPALSLSLYAPILLWPVIGNRNDYLFGVIVAYGSIAIQTVTTWLLGIGSGTHTFIFVSVSVGVFIIGARHRVTLVSISSTGAVAIAASAIWFREPSEFVRMTPELETTLSVISVTAVLLFVSAVTYFGFFIAGRAEDALEAEHVRSEALLYNLLPTEIAARLKQAPDQTIADSLDHTAILFADIVDFTPRSARMPAEELVSFLNRIFSTFDQLAAKHGLEKIKTIGDAYMVAAGLPRPVDRPVHRVAEMAFDMLDALCDLSAEMGDEIEIRIGLHAGPVVAGVIGHQKLFYDVWGDTVNTASRMESHGQAGRIQVTAAAHAALQDDYSFEPRGPVEIKGVGPLETWWLTGRRG